MIVVYCESNEGIEFEMLNFDLVVKQNHTYNDA